VSLRLFGRMKDVESAAVHPAANYRLDHGTGNMDEIVSLGFRFIVAGTLATCIPGAVAGRYFYSV
jgi:hypothetical protein